MIRRLYVEKKAGFDAVAVTKAGEISRALGVKLMEMRVLIRYDIEGLDYEDYKSAKGTIFSEPPVDNVYDEVVDLDGYLVIAVEYLPGQYDQRADSAAQCVQLLTCGKRPLIKTAVVYAFKGDIDYKSLVKYLINPVEARQASMDKPETLDMTYTPSARVAEVEGFIDMTDEQLGAYRAENGFAMSADDIKCISVYFKSEHRNPTITELKVIDTYWSDHCRHTTFSTLLTFDEIETDMPELVSAYENFMSMHNEKVAKKAVKQPTLMNMATIGAWNAKRLGLLDNLDESDEINACTIKVKAEIGDELQDWLILFKNETHNHPTEIEPYGGAATCLGGAIRDPLSGRAYVYQAMRITGAGDVTMPMSETLAGKLPQRVISKTSASGFSSYGNQIGLATGQVVEMHHSGYVAKRLETGFVVGAAPCENVVRIAPEKGDIVVLIGGETGRDGCGGATGSSKAHTLSSLETCGAEVQKGNPLTERKVQRLFRNKEVTSLIKKCNDFGAGGVAVAVGELADGLDIYLDKVPKKYMGLNSTELAISESQERMAVVIRSEDADRIIELCAQENLSGTIIAEVTDNRRMRMFNGDHKVVDISRDFLDTNGASQSATVKIIDKAPKFIDSSVVAVSDDFVKTAHKALGDLNICMQKCMSEMFDSTIGAGSVLMPFGGKYQLTPAMAMAGLLPHKDAKLATISAYGCYPALLSESRYAGAEYSVIASVIKVVLSGGNLADIRLTFQEFFEKLGTDPEKWGKPASALLGALNVQVKLGLGAIGGKDSMSGSFEKLDVPPTLISFALAPCNADKVISNVLESGMKVHKLPLKRNNGLVDLDYLNELLKVVSKETACGNIKYGQMVELGGSAIAVIKSCMGNKCGFAFDSIRQECFNSNIGDMLIVTDNVSAFDDFGLVYVGQANDSGNIDMCGKVESIDAYIASAKAPLEKLYPTVAKASGSAINVDYKAKNVIVSKNKCAKPRVFIPVFPGTNCEYDTAHAFERAGAEADVFVIKNRSESDIVETIDEIARRLQNSQILMFPGGFSGGDEPDGSGKFIATTFRNEKIASQVHELLYGRDGLALGVCNGFQALIKMGLLPNGKISTLSEDSPTLTFNNIARHISQMVNVRVSSKLSPWLAGSTEGDVYGVAMSHGEGRFVASEADLKLLVENGQIATQYADINGNATMESPYNPNGSMMAIEGITSIDGRIFGKMGHIERYTTNLYKNVPFDYDMKVFKSGVKYFK